MKNAKSFVAAFLLGIASIATAQDDDVLRLGWQVPWATQGQLVMAMKYTNILELAEVDVEFHGFSFGGPLNKAALAGEVDLLLTADQPAMVLLARNPDFRIVSRMMYNRVCIYVPVDSPIGSLSDLAGKRILGPVGAAAERVALAVLAENGVDVSGVQVANLDMGQQSALLSRPGSDSEWRGVDALFGFDPLPAVFKEQGKARMLHCDKVVSVVVATRELAEQRPELLERFLRGFRMSWYYFAKNPDELNRLFSRDSRLDVSDAVLDEAASVEPNRWVDSWTDQRLDFVEDDFTAFTQTNVFLMDRGIIEQDVDIRRFIDLTALERSLEGLVEDALESIRMGETAQR